MTFSATVNLREIITGKQVEMSIDEYTVGEEAITIRIGDTAYMITRSEIKLFVNYVQLTIT